MRIIMAPQEQRAQAIGRLYQDLADIEAAELLMDLEANRSLALIVADVVKESLDYAD